MNSVNLIGRLTADPELRYTNSGTAVGSLRLAVDGAGEWDASEEQYMSGFFNVVVWGKQAEVVAEHCGKGRQVGISGRLQFRTYENNDGDTRYITEVVAERVDFLSRPQTEAEPEQPAEPPKSKAANKPAANRGNASGRRGR